MSTRNADDVRGDTTTGEDVPRDARQDLAGLSHRGGLPGPGGRTAGIQSGYILPCGGPERRNSRHSMAATPMRSALARPAFSQTISGVNFGWHRVNYRIGSWKRAAAGSDQPTSARDHRDSRTGHRTQAEPEVDGHATASGLACQTESSGS